MSLTKPFFLTVGSITGGSLWNTSAGNVVEDALALVAFFTGAMMLGGAIFWLRRACGAGEICKLNLPPGPPAAWKVPIA